MRQLVLQNARRALRGKYSPASAVTMLQAGLILLFVSIARALYVIPNLVVFPPVSPATWVLIAVFAVFFALSVIPLHMGALRWFYRVTAGESPDLVEVFDFFASFARLRRAVWLQMTVCGKMLLAAALSQVPAVLIIFALQRYLGQAKGLDALWLAGGMALAALLGLLSLLLAGVWCMRYLPAAFLLAENPDLKVKFVVRQGIELTKGQRSELLLLELSLTGWRLLCLLGLPVLISVPIIQTTRGLAVRVLESRAKQSNEIDFSDMQEV